MLTALYDNHSIYQRNHFNIIIEAAPYLQECRIASQQKQCKHSSYSPKEEPIETQSI